MSGIYRTDVQKGARLIRWIDILLFVIWLFLIAKLSSLVPAQEKPVCNINYFKTVYKMQKEKADTLDSLVTYYANLFRFDKKIIVALIAVESRSFNYRSVNKKGDCLGLMQIDTNTAKWELCPELGLKYSKELLFHPGFNIYIGSYYVYKLAGLFQNRNAWLTAYNAGQGNYRRNPGKFVYPNYKFIARVDSALAKLK